MKKTHKHLNQAKRDRIQALLDNNHKQKDIAKIIGVDKSTISRELSRNRRKIRKRGGTTDGPYGAGVAQHKAYLRRKYAKYQGKKINEDNLLKDYIIKGLKSYWSPDDISGRMNIERQPFYVSKTAIYEWLYSARGQRYCPYLYSKKYRPKKRIKKKTKKTLIPNRKGLELRPEEANNRLVCGHYEGDTMVSGKKTGSKAALSVICDRKSKRIEVEKINSLKPNLFNDSISAMRNRLLLPIKTFTLDNGIENVKYEQLGIPTFFCDPYSSYQKARIEQGIKMLRWFFPKGSDLSNYSKKDVRIAVDTLNNKPRKSLGYKTPNEVYYEDMLNQQINQFKLPIKKPEKVAFRG